MSKKVHKKIDNIECKENTPQRIVIIDIIMEIMEIMETMETVETVEIVQTNIETMNRIKVNHL